MNIGEKELQLQKNVIVVNLDYLYFVYQDMTKHFVADSAVEIDELDLVSLVYSITEEWQLEKDKTHDVEVIFITKSLEEKFSKLKFLKRIGDYDGKGLDIENYKFSFLIAPYEDVSNPEDLFIDLARLSLDSKNTEYVSLINRESDAQLRYEEHLEKYLETVKEEKLPLKNITYYTMADNVDKNKYKQRLLLGHIFFATNAKRN